MRQDIVHPGADKLRYEIREIATVAKRVALSGIPIVWENIGDPVFKGEVPPTWIKRLSRNALKEDATFGYSPTKGLDETCAYIARERNLERGIQITPDDILFFNGLGDGISHLYRNLNPRARILGPDPAYPTHSSAEAAHSDKPHITYRLNPEKEWQPDLNDIEKRYGRIRILSASSSSIRTTRPALCILKKRYGPSSHSRRNISSSSSPMKSIQISRMRGVA